MKRLLVLLAVVALAGGAWFAWHGAGGAAQREGGRRGRFDRNTPVPVVVDKATRQDVAIYLDALGTVQAFNTVSVHAMVDGPLVEVRFKEGQDVKTGDVLAQIDPRPFQAALDSAVAKKQQDQANLANAKLDQARYNKLVASNYTSTQQADTARAQVAQLEAQVRGDQAQIDTAQTQLSYATIKAPIDGRVGLRQVDVGNIVHPADTTPITVITQLKPISVVFTLPQQDLAQVQEAMRGGMPEVDAVRDGPASIPGGAPGPRAVLDRGTLAVLDNQVDPATGTIKLKATFPNADLTLWPGGFVNVRMLVRTERGVLTVPTQAVQRGPKGPFVFQVKPDGTAVQTPIKVGHEDDTASIVLSGVEPGDQVVIDGAQRVTDGGRVAIAGADGNAPDAVPERERGAPGAAQRRRRTSGSS